MANATARETRSQGVTPKDSYRVYHDGLMAQLERDLGKRYLFLAIVHFRDEHATLRNVWERHWNEDRRTPPEAQTDFEIDYEYWERVWNVRRKALRVMQGVEPWPPEFKPWKRAREDRYYLGLGSRPAWLDYEDNVISFNDLRAAVKPASLRSLRMKSRR